MTHPFRSASLVIAGVVVFGSIVSACSGDSSSEIAGATGTSGEASFVDLQADSFSVTVANRVGQPLTDVRIAINPYGTATVYTTSLSRLESTEKRDLSLAEFRGRDGTPFSLRIARPKTITVTAVDLLGEKYEMTVPWKR